MIGAILIVAHNNLHLTKRAVHTALDQTVPVHVLVIDNGSTDSTARWLASKRRRALDEGGSCSVIVPDTYLSLAACWNLGLRTFFRVASITKVLVLNNDVEIRPDSYEMLADYLDLARNPEGLVSMTGTGSSYLGRPGDWSLQDLHRSRIPHPDFSAFLITRDTFYTVGPFDEAYFPAYCEDTDYHVRMHRAGIKAVKVPLLFYHHGSQTLATAPPEERRFIEERATLNRERFRERYGCLPGTPEYDQLFL